MILHAIGFTLLTFAIQKMAGMVQHRKAKLNGLKMMEITRQKLRNLFVSVANFRIGSCSEENDNNNNNNNNNTGILGSTFSNNVNLQAQSYRLD